MPAMLDDPANPLPLRASGAKPYPTADSPLPPGIEAVEVTLRDSSTATIVPFDRATAARRLPRRLVDALCDQINLEIVDRGNTYPMLEPFSRDAFASYWFGRFGAVMLQGSLADTAAALLPDDSPSTSPSSPSSTATAAAAAASAAAAEPLLLGSYYIKPNYPGRSSHVCNAGFMVMDAARGKGAGRVLAESYLRWAPLLGYRYSVFNLVYETNVASCRIWDALGFERIGRVPGCGNLKGFEGRWVDAIVYGRWLVPEQQRGREVEEAEAAKEEVWLKV